MAGDAQPDMNDVIRRFIDLFIAANAVLFRAAIRLRIRTYQLHQAWLRSRYRIDGLGASGYEEQTFSKERGLRMACTSGSTTTPKEIPYSNWRVRRTLLVFVSAMFRNLAAHLPANRTFFALTSTKPDASLTAMLTTDQGPPLYLCGLHAPHRMLVREDLQQALRTYGETAVRVWLMTVSNPGLLYATNPSTIATFLESIGQIGRAHV